ncbi:MAG TPA: class I SAM-dependent methyltransferase [Bryobacteraceae bacterium]|nr:class I SAM-dependent methyltransferase [Bryobacteraceae bacterium]
MESNGRCPLRAGDAGQLAAFRSLLQDSGFNEQGICARLGIAALTDFIPLRKGRDACCELAAPLDLLIRLFLDEECVPAEQIRRMLPGALETMQALGVAAPLEGAPGTWFATVCLSVVGALYIASDRSSLPDGAPFTPAPDVVYPVSDQTLHFLESLPPLDCGTLLDLGTGTGIAALQAAASYAGHARGVDITARSVAFAEFNRLLNGLDNVTVACGDLYEAAGSKPFDRIVAHPPYVPVSGATYVFRDGGEDGEQVLRRIIEGLPRHLAPGGRFYGFGMASDREGEFFEQRIRRWLGAADSEFDVLLAATATMTPDKVKSPRGEEEREHWRRVVDTCRIKHFFYGSILVERHAAPRCPYTVRTHRGPGSGWRETEWLRGWMAAASAEGFQESMLGWRPRLSPRLELRSVHRVYDGRLVPETCTLVTGYPFDSECACRPQIAQVVAGCDGTATGLQYFEECVARKLVPPDLPPAEFARTLAAMISAGFLELDEFPLPDPGSRAADAGRANG